MSGCNISYPSRSIHPKGLTLFKRNAIMNSEKFNNGFNQVMQESRNLRELAQSFRRVGNEKIADELETASQWIEFGCNDMSRAFNEETITSLNFTKEITGKLLSAVTQGKIK